MSLSNPNQGSNGPQRPANLYLEWDSTAKSWKYYDKGKQENIMIGAKITFFVLDQLSTIKGYSKGNKSNFWSNEVRNPKTSEFIIETKNGVAYKGLYGDMKKNDAVGCKFCRSVYIAMKIDGKLQIANIQMVGSSLGAWSDFFKKTDAKGKVIEPSEIDWGKVKLLESKAVECTGSLLNDSGEISFNYPVFQFVEEMTEESFNKAVELDMKLQEYLNVKVDGFKLEDAIPYADRKVTEQPAPTQSEVPPTRESFPDNAEEFLTPSDDPSTDLPFN